MTPRRGAAALLGLVLLVGCSDDDPSAAPSGTGSPTVGQRIAETVEAQLGGVALTLEVADDQQERAVGLMGRTEVPPGTGMVFLYDEPVRASFYMFQVLAPLTAVFVRDGRVVHVAQMEPCAETDASRCPLYGPDGEDFDTVVETDPETLPAVRVGDRLELRG